MFGTMEKILGQWKKFIKSQKFFSLFQINLQCPKKITPKNEKNPLSQIFFAMSQNLHAIFKKFIKKNKMFWTNF